MKRTANYGSLAVAAMMLLPLAACSPAAGDGANASVVADSVASSLADADNLTVIAGALEDSGLGPVFDGPGSYTVLAPTNDAFSALGAEGDALLEDEQRPILIAILREHILPGHLTAESIGKAIDTNDGSVEIRSLGGNVVTFAREGDAIRATGPDGQSASLTGLEMNAENGSILPLDGFIRVPPAAQ